MRYYLAYGSNLNKQQMAYRCPTAKAVGTTNLVGYKLAFRGARTGSYLTIDDDPNSLVPVAVWKVTKRDEMALDRYEGYPSHYIKKDVVVWVNGSAVKAFVYIMQPKPYGIPSDFYVDTCMRGYKDFGLDEYYLNKALRECMEGVNGKKSVS